MRLRIGSQFTTGKGAVLRIQEAFVLVSPVGAESPTVVLERTVGGRSAVVVMSAGVLAHQIRGSIHKPGAGARIDWSQVPRRSHDEMRRPTAPRTLLSPAHRR